MDASALLLLPPAALVLAGAWLPLEPPWRASPFALALALAVAVATGAVGAGWGLAVALTALAPLTLALLASCLPLLHRAARRQQPWRRALAEVSSAAAGVVACRLVLDALVGTSPGAGAAVVDAGQWPAVLAGGAAGLLAAALAG
ncbi:hypothetical protein GTR00_22480, partial [Kineococcus sp. T90]